MPQDKTPKPPVEKAAPSLLERYDTETAYVLYAQPTQADVRPLLGSCRARAVTEVKLARLTDKWVVGCMVPGPSGGQRLTEPVKVSDHWVAYGEDGQVNVQTFLRALAQSAKPGHVKHICEKQDELGTIRLAEA